MGFFEAYSVIHVGCDPLMFPLHWGGVAASAVRKIPIENLKSIRASLVTPPPPAAVSNFAAPKEMTVPRIGFTGSFIRADFASGTGGGTRSASRRVTFVSAQ